MNKAIKNDNDNILENEVEKFIKTIENNSFESEDENSNKDNNSYTSNNIHIIKNNSEEDKNSSSEDDEKDKINNIDDDILMSEELNNILGFDSDIQNQNNDNLEKFIQKFEDLKVFNNSEKNNDLKDIINNTLLLPLNKRIEK